MNYMVMKLIVLNTLNERILKALKFFLQKFYHIYVVITYTLSLNNFKIFLKIFLIFFYRPKLIISGFQHALTYIALDNTIKCFKKLNIKFFLIDAGNIIIIFLVSFKLSLIATEPHVFPVPNP